MRSAHSGVGLNIVMHNIVTLHATLRDYARNVHVSVKILHTIWLIIMSVVSLLLFMADVL